MIRLPNNRALAKLMLVDARDGLILPTLEIKEDEVGGLLHGSELSTVYEITRNISWSMV